MTNCVHQALMSILVWGLHHLSSVEKQVAGAGKEPQAESRPDSIQRVLWEKNEGELPRGARLMPIRAGFGQSGQAVGAYTVTMILPCSVAAVGLRKPGARQTKREPLGAIWRVIGCDSILSK